MAQYDADAPRFLALTIVMGSAATIAVILRFLARHYSKTHYGPDDFFSVLSLISVWGYYSMTIWVSYNGMGYDMTTLPPPVLSTYLKGSYIGDLFAPFPNATARASLLFLYNRVFFPDKTFRRGVLVLHILNIIWFIGAWLPLIFWCIPIEASWNLLIQGSCVNITAYVIGAELPSFVLDFALIGIVLWIIRKLQMPIRHKFSVGAIIVLGSFVGVIGLLRIAATYRPEQYDRTYSFIWVDIQFGFATICCCLPTYRPLLPSYAAVNQFKDSMRLLVKKSTGSLRQRSEGSARSGSQDETIDFQKWQTPRARYELYTDRRET